MKVEGQEGIDWKERYLNLTRELTAVVNENTILERELRRSQKEKFSLERENLALKKAIEA